MNMKPIIKKVKEINTPWLQSHKIERKYIKLANQSDIFNLTNSDDKGPGIGNKIIKPEQKKQISKTLKRKYKKGLIKKTNTVEVSTYNLKGKHLKNYNSISKCMKDIGISRSNAEKLLYKKSGKWFNYQLTYKSEPSPGKYKMIRDNSHLEKEVFVLNINKNIIKHYNSYKSAAKNLNISSPTIRRKIKSGKKLKNKYLISDARLKLDEFSETLEEGNTEPSLMTDKINN